MVSPQCSLAGSRKHGNLRDVSRAARSAPPPPDPPAPHDLLLDGFAVLVTEGRAAAAPMLRRAARVFAEDEIATEEGLRWGWVATIATNVLWDVESWQSIAFRQVQSAREAGLLVHASGLCELAGDICDSGAAILRQLLR